MRIDLALSKIKNNSGTFVKYVFYTFSSFYGLKGPVLVHLGNL